MPGKAKDIKLNVKYRKQILILQVCSASYLATNPNSTQRFILSFIQHYLLHYFLLKDLHPHWFIDLEMSLNVFDEKLW